MKAPTRGKYQGVQQIIRFNWPLYVTAAIGLIAGSAIVALVPLPEIARVIARLGLGFAGFWLIISLLVSHYIYDRSSLYCADWLAAALPRAPSRYATLHVGLDEFSPTLEMAFPQSHSTVIDFFEAAEMTEPSILRARNKNSPASATATPANFRTLPFRDDELDAVFLIFAAHELRKAESRMQLFRELRRILKPGGQIMLVEHLRDFPNFLAFGPGFFHFHSRAQWLRGIAAANLSFTKEFRRTPFVRIFILEKTLGRV